MSSHEAASNFSTRRCPPIYNTLNSLTSIQNPPHEAQPPGFPRDPIHESQPPGLHAPITTQIDPHHNADDDDNSIDPPPPPIPLHIDEDPDTSAEDDVQEPVDTDDIGWGDLLQSKRQKCVRLTFRNIASLPRRIKNDKNERIITDITDTEADIVGLNEVNLAWQRVSQEESLAQRFRPHFEASRFISSNNRTDTPIVTSTQYGGTITGCIGHMTYRINQCGSDDKEIGRWSWIAIRGFDGSITRVLTVYRPCRSQGPTSTYQQQVCALHDLGIIECPRKVFLDDLRELLTVWYNAGDRIVVGGDFNEDVRSHRLRDFFSEFHMSECLLERHGNEAPNTVKGGADPIDGIFCSDGMHIERGGYSPIHWGMGSDHRLLWVDLPFHEFFGGTPPPEWHPKARKLRTDDPRIVTRYNDRKLEELSKKNAIPRLAFLYQQICNDVALTPAMRRELNQLDKIRVDASILAESKCRKLATGNVPWSPELQESINRIRYYRTCIRLYRYGYGVNSRTLVSQARRHQGPAVFNLADAETMLRHSIGMYKTSKLTARDIRYNYLAQLAHAKAQAAAEAHDDDQAAFLDKRSKILEQLQRREEDRRLGSRVKNVMGANRASVSSISIPADDGQWQTVYDRASVETSCINEGIRKRTQANDSPCLQPDQLALFGQLADSAISDQILQGNVTNPDDFHPDLQTLLPYWKMPESIRTADPIDLSISLEDYKKGWRKQKEDTSSHGPMHFGHFKASIYNDTLAEFDRMFLEIGLRTGHILPRWLHGTDVLIPKKVNSDKVTELRTICLLASDWNFGNKMLSSRIMYHAERHGTIAPEQYGSRKGKSSIQHATNKALLFDIQRQRKENSTLMILDAEACYDRIPLHIAALCLRRQGLPISAINYMFSPIYDMKHNIRTSFGESDQCYRSREHRLHGILQGNGAGPCIWVMVSSPLLDHLRTTRHGIQVKRFGFQTSLLIPAFAFVDDVDVVEKSLRIPRPLVNSQSSLTTWSTDLQAIGGNLKWAKCFWQWLVFIWNGQNRWNLKKIHEDDDALIITTADGENVTLQRKEVDEATLALGIMFSIDGSMKDEITLLKTRVSHWCDRIRTKPLSKTETWYALQRCTLRSLHYPLMATTISQDDMHKIMSPLLQTILPRAGYYRNIDRDVVFSKSIHRGCDVQDPWVSQGLEKLLLILNEENDSMTSTLLMTSFHLCAREHGLGPQFLCTPLTPSIKHLITWGIIASLWEFCSVHSIKPHFHQAPIHRFPGDFYLSQQVLDLTTSKPTLLDFKACRTFLQVDTLSDIISLDGRRFLQACWTGTNARILPDWPYQPRPSNSAWKTWQALLRSMIPCNEDGIFMQQVQVQFFDPSSWLWFCSEDGNFLFQKSSQHIQTYSLLPHDPRFRARRRNRRYQLSDTITPSLPDSCQAITVIRDGALYFIESMTTAVFSDLSDPPALQWQTSIERSSVGNHEILKDALLKGDLVMVSDGSYKKPFATGAYIITTETDMHTHYISGAARTTGPASVQESYRAELFGILAGFVRLNQLLLRWDLQHHPVTITIGCDNLNALIFCFDRGRHPHITSRCDHFDVILSIRSIIPENVRVIPIHVEGHQDKHAAIATLDFLSRLNIQMDTKCKALRRRIESHNPDHSWTALLPGWQWLLEVNGSLVTKNIRDSIECSISSNRMSTYLDRKHRLPAQIFHTICWDAIGSAIKSQPIGYRRFITKHSVGVCGVNIWRHRWQDRTDDACPRCGAPESSRHVYMCRDDVVTDLWKTELALLEQWLEDHQTSPCITSDIMHNLTQLSLLAPFRLISTNEQEQGAIGWHNLFEGLLHVNWETTQQAYFDQQALRDRRRSRSARLWVRAFFLKLWNIHHVFWTSRNEAEHTNDFLHSLRKFNEQIQDELDTGFADIHNNSHQYMYSPREIDSAFASTNLNYKRSWIRNIRALRLQQPNPRPPRARFRNQGNQRFLPDYFHAQA